MTNSKTIVEIRIKIEETQSKYCKERPEYHNQNTSVQIAHQGPISYCTLSKNRGVDSNLTQNKFKGVKITEKMVQKENWKESPLLLFFIYDYYYFIFIHFYYYSFYLLFVFLFLFLKHFLSKNIKLNHPEPSRHHAQHHPLAGHAHSLTFAIFVLIQHQITGNNGYASYR